ncbi:MAG: glycine cleavage system aminomethyltransferase GcvT [Prolixibacteraceae bacterium]|jgi:aminomethyltransferase|nr:glycine cleavage system aminomethyltransferase GcvT [Prolixibacteraceae bacterium]MBT6767049.1 glycine cleavage system aminomethyltransferase GcvT [Prolixibacteraceae bacterium]MBT6998821.1 glycine cleavage system aminomethyltransferase GcvT [Prolixibacteraceae bacterium]MBT7396789.1 glycine cleavage system aminomethyltransferase GcvT [Prolixibacteraceae bacterium]
MNKTAFNELHKKAGGKLVEFAGFEMPIEYSGIKDEHLTVRKSVGVFDVSHMGEFWVKGPNAQELVSKITSNDPRILKPGQAQYSCFPNGKGGIVDDLLVYCYEPEKYMLVVNAANIEKDWNWVVSQNDVGAEIENASGRVSQLAIQGPKALETLQKLTNINLSEVKFYTFVTDKIAGVDDVIISATGYTGAGGFELYFRNEAGQKIWNSIFEAGKEFGIKPIGLAARDTLRLEMGYCLYGNDIDDTTSPIEAGLGWITKFNHGRKFIDREYLMMQKTEGVTRKLRGFVMLEKGIPRHGYELVNSAGAIIGNVTSGTMSPMLNKGIGMGYVAKEYSAFGTRIFVKIRNKTITAEIVKLPFI